MLNNSVPGTQYIFSLRACMGKIDKICSDCEPFSDELTLYTADGEEFMSSHYYRKG